MDLLPLIIWDTITQNKRYDTKGQLTHNTLYEGFNTQDHMEYKHFIRKQVTIVLVVFICCSA